MTPIIRKERKLSVKDQKLSDEEKNNLALLFTDPRYESLLDVMERACIEQETALINAPGEEPERILAEHALAKAFWKVFVYVQNQVKNAFDQRAGQGEEKDIDPVERENRRILGVEG